MNISAGFDHKALNCLPVLVVSAGFNDFQDHIYRPNGAPYHHIFYVVEGSGILNTPEGSFKLSAGEAVFMRRDILTDYYADGDVFKTAWVTFIGKGAEDILKYHGAENFVFIKSKSIFTAMMNVYNHAERGSSPDVLSQLAFELINIFFTKAKYGKSSNTLVLAKQFIEENYTGDVSVADIAGHLGVSESLIYKVFKENNEKTPAEYLRFVRIRVAQRLLLSDISMPVSEVGRRCGFVDTAYFCKVFKGEIGMSPKKYQKNFKM